MDDSHLQQLRQQLAARIVEHIVETRGHLARPGDPVATLRRRVLRGLGGS